VGLNPFVREQKNGQSVGGMEIEFAKQPERWDRYVESARLGTLYHTWAWREVIEHSFGHQAFYLTAVRDGTICGVLPLVRISSRLFGDFLVSLPFCSHGGILADNQEAADALLAAAAELARELRVHHIELRQRTALPTAWHQHSHRVVMEIELPATIDDYLRRLSSARRKRIRYLLKHQLRPEWTGLEGVSEFYRIFAVNMRNLGTPVYPREFFEQQLCRLSDKVRILILRDGSQAVAAGLVSAYRETLELPWAASLPESRRKEAPTLLYWSLIEKAIEEGFKRLDLGRCVPGSGNYQFKQHWQPIAKPLNWYYWLAPGTAIRTFGADNPKFRLATALWKRLPLAVANTLGPRVVRCIP